MEADWHGFQNWKLDLKIRGAGETPAVPNNDRRNRRKRRNRRNRENNFGDYGDCEQLRRFFTPAARWLGAN